ncbi:hypothetical protein HDF16_002417 [Granulicella aggregans]|uniref:DUF4097 domain-containing protein n=1 Tax=Granulicella aggregans TaxID=474949 RepID=A0A7W7ZD32_9BACT|nr:DUF4097 family beta strand repeat-containing protein [Granulicella aggregans]MBB5057711.1 hypothetical protein [Granulicella aggregans]
MKITGVVFAMSAVLAVSVAAQAQDGVAWEKSYPVSSQAKLVFETGDSGLTVRSCGSCTQVHVKVVLKNRSLSDFLLQEGQSGNAVNFSFKEKPHLHVSWHGSERKSEVVVETPSEVSLDARTEDGGLVVSGLHGEMNLRTSDGGQMLDHLTGALKLQASDGQIRIRDSSGTLEARSSDGGIDIAGSYTAIQLHSSDGGIKADLSQGGNLSTESRVESSDGGVTMVLPKNFAAEFDIQTRDGGLMSTLPLMVDGYNSKHSSGHNIHGKMNGGGALLTIHTSDGGVRLSTAS